MPEKASPNLPSEIVEAGTTCTLDELCLSCKVDAQWIAELVEYGAIEPVGQNKADWTFTHLTIVRVAKAKRLQRDLALDISGLALALELLDEIDGLRLRLKAFESER